MVIKLNEDQLPDKWASGGHDDPVRGQRYSVVANQN